MTEVELFRARIALLQAFLRENKYDGILLSRVDNFAMATGGKRNYVNFASDGGANSLFVTKDGKAYFVGNTIEEPRVMAEELGPLGCESQSFLWFADDAASTIEKNFSGTLVSDDGALGQNVNGAMDYIRALLTPAELDKYRKLGALAADAMTATVQSVRAGMAEADIASILIAEGAKRRCMVPVALIAADERIARFRHPLPTVGPLTHGSLAERAVKGYVMIVGCFQREGLVASITRFRQVADIPANIHDAYKRVCGVDAIMQEASEPGKTLGDVFAACQKAYKDLGFPENEWHNHHQGGTTGYGARTAKGAPGERFPIVDTVWPKRVKEIAGIDVPFGHAFAWNPSGVGVKSEDTFILSADGKKEIVTSTPSLPQVDLGKVLGRSTSVVKTGITGA
ncbi:MAG: M24 family metallopeptidase [Candidatus Hydrogenedentes bacterium]|nr:M24 family metallopeptidase [Candidatus Hydrogenedentota bacterium]